MIALASLAASGCDSQTKTECESLIAAIQAVQPRHLTADPEFSDVAFLTAQAMLLTQHHVPVPSEFPKKPVKQCQGTLDLLMRSFPGIPLRDLTLELLTSAAHLWDPHSDAISPTELAGIGGVTRGFGFNIDRSDASGRVEIVDVIAGSPADVAGLREGMAIWTLNHKYVRQISTAELHAMVSNEKAASLLVGVVGATTTSQPTSYQEVVVNHGEFEASPVRLDTFTVREDENDFSLGYIKLRSFIGAQAFFAEGLKTFKNAEALLLDLRNNSGGEIQAAADLASLLRPRGDLFVGLQGRSGSAMELVKMRGADPGPADRPLVVLVDPTTKSAAEILAGALQDYGAIVVGARTFGKGTRQTLVPLAEYGLSGALLLTDAFSVRPSGRVIQQFGIMPDVPLPYPGHPRFEESLPRALAAPSGLQPLPGYDPATALPPSHDAAFADRLQTLARQLGGEAALLTGAEEAAPRGPGAPPPATPESRVVGNSSPVSGQTDIILEAAKRVSVFLIRQAEGR